MIRLEGVSKSFKGFELFNDINCEFPLGKKILIKGPNGSGKSVLLKMIVGFLTPDTGKILVEDEVIGQTRDFIQDAGISINAPEFQHNLSGLDNLIKLANIRNVADEKDIIAYAKVLKLNHLDKKYKNYSMGMKQKMRIIQAIMDQPKYLILDEPFDALDKESQRILRDLLDEYVTENRLLIYTNHNLEHENFADMIFEIDDYMLKECR